MDGNAVKGYLVGTQGPAVMVPARVAAWLEVRAGLSSVRAKARGTDPEVDAVLFALRMAGLAWRTSATGSEVEPEPEVPRESSQWLSTGQAAELLGITDRAVRLAIREGRLDAEQVAGRYRISRPNFEHYRAARAA
ncbi:helix-turn-helix domain-containing protein [Cellulosimicrobium sp. 72-3]|uniref:helix-turn-helix domain-containing protein n=1 Tax=Cellulosimicrobium sp. 72-3 TaxID=2731680 RepID=UPI00148EBBA5|nr:helix-turn-helix domain-containing protein [Cellulosimicrobium sp. 72-3]